MDGSGFYSLGMGGGRIEGAFEGELKGAVALRGQKPIDGGFIQPDDSLVGGLVKHVGELQHNFHGRLGDASACIQDLDPAAERDRRVARVIGGTD